MSFQKVMKSIKAILSTVEKSKEKTKKVKDLKKQKIQFKKEAGDFVPENEFKKKKEEKEQKKIQKREQKQVDEGLKVDFKKSKEILNKKIMEQNASEEDSGPKLEVVKTKTSEFKSRIAESESEEAPAHKNENSKKHEPKIQKSIQKTKQKTSSFKSYDQYARKDKRSELNQMQKEERPFRSYGVEGNIERREKKIQFIQAQKEAMKSANSAEAKNLKNPDGNSMNRTQRRDYLRKQAGGEGIAVPQVEKNAFSQKGPEKSFKSEFKKHDFKSDRNERGVEQKFVRETKPAKEWKAGQGSNHWDLENMHPSWAAKRNMETQELGSFSKVAAKPKVIEL